MFWQLIYSQHFSYLAFLSLRKNHKNRVARHPASIDNIPIIVRENSVKLTSIIILLTLSAIWGSSYLFMRIAVPSLGPAYLMEARVLFAALFLLVISWLVRKPLNLKRNALHFFILGSLNTAVPFLLLAYSAKTLTASLMAVVVATAPIWGAVLDSIWSRTAITITKLLGMIVGITGVSVLVGFDSILKTPGADLAVLACLGAAAFYGIASVYTKNAPKLDSLVNAHGSMWGASVFIIPFLFFMPATQTPASGVLIAVLTLGVVCTGIAYVLFFKLIKDVGPTSALTVTFLVPAFGILWGHIFLNETIGWYTFVGSGITIMGTAMVTGISIKPIIKRLTPQRG